MRDDNEVEVEDVLMGAADVIGEPDSLIVVTVPSEGLLITVSAANLTEWLTETARARPHQATEHALGFAREINEALSSARARAAREAAEEAEGGDGEALDEQETLRPPVES